MGVLPFRTFTSRIPKDTKEIYVITDGEARTKKHVEWKFANASSIPQCRQVIAKLFDTLVAFFPNSVVAVLKGHHLLEDFLRIGFSPITFCSLSTFCIWPAMANNGTVYIPTNRNGLIAGGTRPFLGESLHWLTDPSALDLHSSLRESTVADLIAELTWGMS